MCGMGGGSEGAEEEGGGSDGRGGWGGRGGRGGVGGQTGEVLGSFRVFRVQGAERRVQGAGCRVQGVDLVEGAGHLEALGSLLLPLLVRGHLPEASATASGESHHCRGTSLKGDTQPPWITLGL